MSNIQLASVEVDNTAAANPTYDLATPIPDTMPKSRTSQVRYVLRNKGTANAYVRANGTETETAIIVMPTGVPQNLGPYLWNSTKSKLPKLLLETGAHVIVTPIIQGV